MAAGVLLVRRVSIEVCMRDDFVVLPHAPTDQLSYGCDVFHQCAEPLEIAWQGSRGATPAPGTGLTKDVVGLDPNYDGA